MPPQPLTLESLSLSKLRYPHIRNQLRRIWIRGQSPVVVQQQGVTIAYILPLQVWAISGLLRYFPPVNQIPQLSLDEIVPILASLTTDAIVLTHEGRKCAVLVNPKFGYSINKAIPTGETREQS